MECFLLFTARGSLHSRGLFVVQRLTGQEYSASAFFEGTPVFGGSVKDVTYFSSIIEISQPLAHRYAIFLCFPDDYLTRPKKSNWAANYSTTHTYQIHGCARKPDSIL